MIEKEVKDLCPRALTPGAQLVLRVLADSAGLGHRMVWLALDTVAIEARLDQSTVYAGLRQLRTLNILADVPRDEWPAEARRYRSVVRKINPSAEWDLVYDKTTGQDIDQRIDTSEIPTPDLGIHHPNQIHNQQQQLEVVETPSLLPIRPAGASTKTPKPTTDDDLDPASAVGPYAAESRPVRKSGKTQPDPDTGMGLANYFRTVLETTNFGRRSLMVPDAIAYKALAKVLTRWMKDGTTPHLIRTWMDAYAKAGTRRPGAPAWKSFLASRAQFAIASIEEADLAFGQLIMNDHTSPEFLAYWGVTAEDVAPLVPA